MSAECRVWISDVELAVGQPVGLADRQPVVEDRLRRGGGRGEHHRVALEPGRLRVAPDPQRRVGEPLADPGAAALPAEDGAAVVGVAGDRGPVEVDEQVGDRAGRQQRLVAAGLEVDPARRPAEAAGQLGVDLGRRRRRRSRGCPGRPTTTATSRWSCRSPRSGRSAARAGPGPRSRCPGRASTSGARRSRTARGPRPGPARRPRRGPEPSTRRRRSRSPRAPRPSRRRTPGRLPAPRAAWRPPPSGSRGRPSRPSARAPRRRPGRRCCARRPRWRCPSVPPTVAMTVSWRPRITPLVVSVFAAQRRLASLVSCAMTTHPSVSDSASARSTTSCAFTSVCTVLIGRPPPGC